MKELERTITRTVTETKTVYVAQDGEEFTDKEQCKRYEVSAEAACRARLNMRKIERGSNGGESTEASSRLYWAHTSFRELFDYGYEADLYVWKPKSEEEIKTFLQWQELIVGERPLMRKELPSRWAAPYKCLPDELEAGKTYIVACEEGCSEIRVTEREKLGNALGEIFDTLEGINE